MYAIRSYYDPGNTVASVTSVCVGSSFNLSLQNQIIGDGITYQWQSSPDMVTWSNIGTGLNTLSTTTTASTYYQCIVTCTNSSETATSTPVLVRITSYNVCYTKLLRHKVNKQAYNIV